MNETMMTVSGNLVSDVTLGATTRGDAMARFRMASTTKRYDRTTGQWLDGDTTYWNVPPHGAMCSEDPVSCSDCVG